MEDGINKGIEVLNASRTGSPKYIILLSDGLPNEGADSLQELLSGSVKRAQEAGITIHTVAFGSDSNEELLKGIADYTGGHYSFANDFFALSSVYIRFRHESLGDVVYQDTGALTLPAASAREPSRSRARWESSTAPWTGARATVLDFKLYDPHGSLVDNSYPGATLFRRTATPCNSS